jgi:hypothetical protein
MDKRWKATDSVQKNAKVVRNNGFNLDDDTWILNLDDTYRVPANCRCNGKCDM